MTIQAGPDGVLVGKFTIPSGIRAGVKSVQFIGAGGSRGAGVFRGQGSKTTENWTTLINEVWSSNFWDGGFGGPGRPGVDPLAQTFSLTADAAVSGVDLWFTVKGNGRVLAQIRDTTVGLPNQTILAQGEILPASIQNAPASSRVTWTPVRLNAGHEYALVIACDNPDAEVQIAELGKYDAVAQRWVTSQPYQVGVLLSSSNASTWTAHQDRDLTFRLLGSLYSATQTALDLPPITVANAHEALILAQVDRPTAECDVQFELTLPDPPATVITAVENQPLTFPSPITGTITWRALLRGTVTASPRLAPDIQLVCGTRSESANYITRAIPASANCKIAVYYDVLTPGASTVAIGAQNGATWANVPLVNSTPIGDNWVSVKRQLLTFSPANNLTRIQLTLNGSSTQRPIVRNLQVVITP